MRYLVYAVTGVAVLVLLPLFVLAWWVAFMIQALVWLGEVALGSIKTGRL